MEQETVEFIESEVDLEYPEADYTLPKENCRHCGGLMRYYRGSVSCIMCGRDGVHHCSNCIHKESVFSAAAPSSNGAAA